MTKVLISILNWKGADQRPRLRAIGRRSILPATLQYDIRVVDDNG